MQGTTWSGQKLSQSQNKGKVDMIRSELHKQDPSSLRIAHISTSDANWIGS